MVVELDFRLEVELDCHLEAFQLEDLHYHHRSRNLVCTVLGSEEYLSNFQDALGSRAAIPMDGRNEFHQHEPRKQFHML